MVFLPPGAMLGGDLSSANGACPSPVGEYSCSSAWEWARVPAQWLQVSRDHEGPRSEERKIPGPESVVYRV